MTGTSLQGQTQQNQQVQQQFQALDTKVDRQFQSLSHAIDNKLEDQMKRIESLFQGRREWLSTPTKPKFRVNTWGSKLLWFAFFFQFMRIGEAINPGPTDPVQRHQIGTINPNGLLGKGHLFRHMPSEAGGTIWAVSETHLTKRGKSKFDKELHHNATGFQTQMGAPVPPKSATVSAVGGKHRGVGFITNRPCRAMTATWTEELWQENRVHATTFQFGQRSIQGGVVYGHAVQPETVATKQRTDLQCQALTNRLVHHGRGLRFIAGDFNQLDGEITSMTEWANAGWINIQKWAFDVLGKPILPTCHQSTTKDHVFVSPELAMYLHDVHVDDSWFSDHAILWATFDPFGKPPMIPLWRQVKPLPWDECRSRTPCTQVQPLVGSPTDQYQQLCASMESQVCQHLQQRGLQCPAQSLGLAKTREVHMIQEYTAPPKKGREGDPQPHFHGCDLAHAQWIRQLRKLTNYAKLAKKATFNATQRAHCFGLWRSIRFSPGFRPSFEVWWISHAPPAIPCIPELPPTAAIADDILKHFSQHFRAMEKALLQSRVAQARHRRADDPMIIFRDLQGDPPAPVQMLVQKTKASVTGVDPEEQAFDVDPPQQWDPDKPLLLDRQAVSIVHAEPDRLWVDPMPADPAPRVASQETDVSSLPDIVHAFRCEWQKRWDKHLGIPESHWDPMMQLIDRILPPLPAMTLEPITVDLWLHTLRKKSRKAAVGPDSVTRQDLLNMDPMHIAQLLQILHQVEATGQWPEQLLEAFVIALEKEAGADQVQQYRPICILPVCYRTWSSIRAKQILLHLAPFAPSTCLKAISRAEVQLRCGINSWSTSNSARPKPINREEESSTWSRPTTCCLDCQSWK